MFDDDAEAMEKYATSAEAEAQAEAEYDMFLVDLATFMHDEYEKMAKVVGWKTQESCRVEFKDLPPANKTVMIAVAEAVYKRLCKGEDDVSKV